MLKVRDRKWYYFSSSLSNKFERVDSILFSPLIFTGGLPDDFHIFVSPAHSPCQLSWSGLLLHPAWSLLSARASFCSSNLSSSIFWWAQIVEPASYFGTRQLGSFKITIQHHYINSRKCTLFFRGRKQA